MPSPLPLSPALELAEIALLLEKANHALGQLDSTTSLLPDTSLLIYFYVRKEALLSSQIEGTQSSFDDLLFYENQSPASVPVEDVEEVPHYVAGLQHGIERMRKGLPLSLCLMKESVLYFSLYLKKHRSHYYDLLNKVRADGAWEVGNDKAKDCPAETAERICLEGIYLSTN